jgi:preprotein translocase subunit SecB
MSEIKSVLKLDKLVFDKISFDRKGFKNQNPIEFTIESRFAQNQQENVYRVTLILQGDKKKNILLKLALQDSLPLVRMQTWMML